MKRILKEMKWDALLKGVLYIVLGVMALALPEAMEEILGYMIGIVLIIGGAVSMIAYLIRDAHQNYYHNDFLHGLIGIAAGILVIAKIELVSGCSKLQDVIDMKRLECGNWIAMLIFAVINVAFGVLLICNPFAWTTLLFRLLGVGLIFSGIIDCASTVYFADRIRKYLEALETVDSTFVEMTETDASKEKTSQGAAGQKAEAAEKSQRTAGQEAEAAEKSQRTAGQEAETAEKPQEGTVQEAGNTSQTQDF